MLKLIRKYKAVSRFIIVFLGTYALLAWGYNWYLDYFSAHDEPDFLTYLVALQSEVVISAIGYNATVAASTEAPLMHLYIDEKFIARIIEGCNAASIIILFISFMLAFFGKWKSTLLYIVFGIAFIYIINILRIALLSIGIYELPQYSHLLHKIVFPLVIYGSVFLLWILWIRIYTTKHV